MKACAYCHAPIDESAAVCRKSGGTVSTPAAAPAPLPPAPERARQSRLLPGSIAGALLIAALLVACRGRTGADGQPSQEAAAGAGAAASPAAAAGFRPVKVDPAALRQALEKGLRVTGRVVRRMTTEYVGTSTTTYLISDLDVTLANQSKYGVVLGPDLMLVEADAAGGTFDGVYHSRGRPKIGDGFSFHGNGNDPYRLSSADNRHPDGKVTRLLGGGSFVTVKFGDLPADSAQDGRGFPPLPPRQIVRIAAAFQQGAWVGDATLASIRVALPELQVATRAGTLRFRLIAYFTRPAKPDEPWAVGRTELVSLESATLRSLLDTPENNRVTRVLAANWLGGVDPAQAPAALCRAAATQGDGELLAACLTLLSDNRSRGLEEHALGLLRNEKTPVGIRRLAAIYLGKVACAAAVPTLAPLANSTESDDPLAETAIAALGDIADPKSLDVLLALAHSSEASPREKAIATSLARTGAPAAIEELRKQGRAGSQAALEALADARLPGGFEYFAELAAQPADDSVKDVILGALARADPKQSVPVLLDLLKQEAPPEPNSPEMYGPPVRALIGLGADAPWTDLTALARAGNLRALQVLANSGQEPARAFVAESAASARGLTRRIALMGLRDHAPGPSVALFTAALDDPEAENVSVAISGLQASGDSGGAAALLRLLTGDHAQEAAQALQFMEPGAAAPEVLSALLATSDGSVANCLASRLIDHQFSDRESAKRLVARLDTVAPEVQFQLIRLLRQVSSNAVGPEEWSDFEKEPAAWVARWKAWAAGGPAPKAPVSSKADRP